MPFINGRYYMNPFFGAALERARDAEEGGTDSLTANGTAGPELSDGVYRYRPFPAASDEIQLDSAEQGQGRGHHPKPQQKHRAQKPSETAHQPGSPAQNANRVYNETSGLRPTTTHGPGSAQDLHDARSFIAHVLENRETSGKLGIVAPDKLRPSEAHAIQAYPPAKQAYADSTKAAQSAASSSDPTKGATNYYLDYGQNPPPWAAGKKPVRSFGPFVDASGGGGVHNPKKGDKVHVRVYHMHY